MQVINIRKSNEVKFSHGSHTFTLRRYGLFYYNVTHYMGEGNFERFTKVKKEITNDETSIYKGSIYLALEHAYSQYKHGKPDEYLCLGRTTWVVGSGYSFLYKDLLFSVRDFSEEERDVFGIERLAGTTLSKERWLATQDIEKLKCQLIFSMRRFRIECPYD